MSQDDRRQHGESVLHGPEAERAVTHHLSAPLGEKTEPRTDHPDGEAEEELQVDADDEEEREALRQTRTAFAPHGDRDQRTDPEQKHGPPQPRMQSQKEIHEHLRSAAGNVIPPCPVWKPGETSVPCTHIGGPEMIEMAEAVLRARGIDAAAWRGSHFRFIQNLDEGPWAAVWLELERRGDEWLVTKIDRFPEKLPEEETGFRVLRIGEGE